MGAKTSCGVVSEMWHCCYAGFPPANGVAQML